MTHLYHQIVSEGRRQVEGPRFVAVAVLISAINLALLGLIYLVYSLIYNGG